MHIARIRLKNFGPYRGEHELPLDAIPYSITAELEGNSERSNFCGKSYLLEAVPFCLYGLLPGSHVRADAWISKGEEEGHVLVELSDGTIFHRWRQPGAGTQINVSRATDDAQRIVKGEEAEKQVAQRIGLGLEDFRTTGWLEQGAASAIVRGDPATRTAMVSRWLGIEKLERALQVARSKASTISTAAGSVQARIEAQRERLKRALGEGQNVLTEQAFEVAEAKLVEWDELLALANEEEASKRLAKERAMLEAEIAPLTAELYSDEGEDLLSYECESGLEASKRARDAAQARHQAARVKRANRKSVASGTFNGRCPVAGIECPATAAINDLGLVAHEEAERAAQEERALEEVMRAAEVELRGWEERDRQRRASMAKLQALQERLAAMGGGDGAFQASGLVLAAVRLERERVFAEVVGLRARIKEAAEARGTLRQLEEEAKRSSHRLQTAREGVALLARAPRVLAEGTLGRISADANRVLAEADVSLSFSVSWEREGRDPADACEACGAAFPKSARVKACETCGEPRGLKKIRRMDYEFSDRSGAAEDFVGLAMSLSAGSWLRGERGSSFGMALLDEPCAQMDRCHRRLMSAHLPRMLAAARIEQALVVSHDPSSVASLPGRIVIRRAGKWARVEVAA